MCYDYAQLCKDIQALTENYNYIEVTYIGKSLMDKNIPCLKIGTGDKKLLLSGAYHGLEYLTAAFLMKFLSNYALKIKEKDLAAAEFFSKITLYTIPMVNPDGVDIAVNGLDITNAYHRKLISMVGIHSFNNVWQANARGVDINHNYDANWQMIMEKPSPSKYGGEYAQSEPETRATVDFIRKENFDMLIAFHSQGREIYYDFDGMRGKKSEELAKKLAKESGYAVCVPTGTASFGGCKDWFIKEFGKEGFTVEIGQGKNPLPLKLLDKIYPENEKLIFCAMNEIKDEI
jgi:g-D-glutamyl-meso-diaminopimelate peptidase